MNLKRNKYIEIVIAVTFVIVLIYVASMTVEITRGVSRTLKPPDHTIRLQVLNGCGISRLASDYADKLADYYDEKIEIKVVDIDNFELNSVSETFVISRIRDKTAAKLLAERLKLDPGAVIYKELENNYRHVTATLVLGEDYEKIRIPGNENEES